MILWYQLGFVLRDMVSSFSQEFKTGDCVRCGAIFLKGCKGSLTYWSLWLGAMSGIGSPFVILEQEVGANLKIPGEEQSMLVVE